MLKIEVKLSGDAKERIEALINGLQESAAR